MLRTLCAMSPFIPITTLWRKYPIWQRKEQSLREVRWLAEEHTDGESQSWHLNPGLSDFRTHDCNYDIVLGLERRTGGIGPGNLGVWCTLGARSLQEQALFFPLPRGLSLLLHTNGREWLSPALGPVPAPDPLVLITNRQPCRPNMMHKIFLGCGI